MWGGRENEEKVTKCGTLPKKNKNEELKMLNLCVQGISNVKIKVNTNTTSTRIIPNISKFCLRLTLEDQSISQKHCPQCRRIYTLFSHMETSKRRHVELHLRENFFLWYLLMYQIKTNFFQLFSKCYQLAGQEFYRFQAFIHSFDASRIQRRGRQAMLLVHSENQKKKQEKETINPYLEGKEVEIIKLYS